MVTASSFVSTRFHKTMITVSIVLDEDRIDYIKKHITIGAREFSKWVRDAIDLRIEFEQRSASKRLREEAARIARSQVESELRRNNLKAGRRKRADSGGSDPSPTSISPNDARTAVEE